MTAHGCRRPKSSTSRRIVSPSERLQVVAERSARSAACSASFAGWSLPCSRSCVADAAHVVGGRADALAGLGRALVDLRHAARALALACAVSCAFSFACSPADGSAVLCDAYAGRGAADRCGAHGAPLVGKNSPPVRGGPTGYPEGRGAPTALSGRGRRHGTPMGSHGAPPSASHTRAGAGPPSRMGPLQLSASVASAWRRSRLTCIWELADAVADLALGEVLDEAEPQHCRAAPAAALARRRPSRAGPRRGTYCSSGRAEQLDQRRRLVVAGLDRLGPARTAPSALPARWGPRAPLRRWRPVGPAELGAAVGGAPERRGPSARSPRVSREG